MKLILTFLLIIKISYSQKININIADDIDQYQVYYLEPGFNLTFTPDETRFRFTATDFRIFCYKGCEKILTNYFQTIYLQLDIDNDNFVQYEGYSPETVKKHYNENKSLFSFSFFTYKKTRLKLNPFNQTCTGIETSQPYKIRLNLIRIDITKLCLLTIGIVIFFYASKLSTNSIFYYSSGIGLGISASLLILIYLSGKLFPSTNFVRYSVLIGGWTIAYYMLNLLFDNIQLILVTYHTYVLWYILITGFISFVICYRLGPPKNKRSKDLTKWSLQLAALIAIYFSSQFNEATYVIIFSIILLYYFPKHLLAKLRKSYRTWIPPKRRLLTIEEFEAEGIVETKKALKQLRQYCSSPECKSWKIMSKLKNPKRFASFIEGENHIWEDEIFDYENSRDDTSNDSAKSGDKDLDDAEMTNEEQISEDDESQNVLFKSNRNISTREFPLRNSSINSSGHRIGFEQYNRNIQYCDSRSNINNRDISYDIGWKYHNKSSGSHKKSQQPKLSTNYYEYSDDE